MVDDPDQIQKDIMDEDAENEMWRQYDLQMPRYRVIPMGEEEWWEDHDCSLSDMARREEYLLSMEEQDEELEENQDGNEEYCSTYEQHGMGDWQPQGEKEKEASKPTSGSKKPYYSFLGLPQEESEEENVDEKSNCDGPLE